MPIRSILFFLIAQCSFFFSKAQTYSDKESFRFGYTVGMTSTRILNDTTGYSSGIMFNAGLFGSLSLNDRVNLTAEVLYTGKAVRIENPILKYRYFYADVPVMLQFKLADKFRLNAGLQYSKFINSKISRLDTIAGSGTHISTYKNIRDQDLSMLAGLEIDLGKSIAIAARYNLSTSIFSAAKGPDFGVFTLSFRYTAFRSYRVFFGAKENN